MKLFENVEKCCGCSACYNICPKKAISMEKDKKGFSYPVIDKMKCIDCGLCKKVCPQLTKKQNEKKSFKVIIAKNLDNEVRRKSSSGAIFSLISDYILGRRGVIYGAGFDERLFVRHKRAENEAERDEFRGSKYIQSDINSIYQEVYNDLKLGKYVLFTGCACQIDGLYSFLDIKKCSLENLYTQDFICHGVGSPAFYYDYLKYYEKKYGGKAIKINFRGKPKPGKLQNICIDFNNGKKYTAISTNQDIFYYHFLNNLILRPSCYECQYSGMSRKADITLADCFNPKGTLKELNDKEGLSLVMINTQKGEKLYDAIKEKMNYQFVKTSEYLEVINNGPAYKNRKTDMFWQEYIDNGFLSAIKKYGNYDLKNRMKKIVIYSINFLGLDSIIKDIIKKK